MRRQFQSRHRPFAFAAAWLLLFAIIPSSAAELPSPQGTLTVRVYPKYLIANLPTALRLKVTNTGQVDFGYWCGGPGRYPPGDEFLAIVADANGNAREYRLSNGQYTQGSGNNIAVKTGGSVWLPVMLEPMPAGKYVLREIRCQASGTFAKPGAPMDVSWPAMSVVLNQPLEIRNDPEFSARYQEELLAQVRRYDAFAEHIASSLKVPSVIKGMLEDLQSDDSRTASIAADFFFQVESPRSAGFLQVLDRIVTKQLAAENPDWDLLSRFISLAGQEGTDDALAIVQKYVLDDRAVRQSRYVVQELFAFNQPAATATLRRLVELPIGDARFTAAVGLSNRQDPAALPVLISVSQYETNPDRFQALSCLGMYYSNTDAIAAVVAATHSTDKSFRERAVAVFQDMERSRKSLPPAAILPATTPATSPAGISR